MNFDPTVTPDDATANLVCRQLPLGHDEDRDGIDDSCDVCPHIADVQQPDGDGDLVGDNCDWEPTIPRQSIALFDPFITLDAAWFDIRMGTIEGDELVLRGMGSSAYAYRPYVPGGHEMFFSAAEVGPEATMDHMFAIDLMTDAAGASYYCELYDNTTAMRLTFTHNDGVGNYLAAGTTMMTTRLVAASGMLSYRVDANSGYCDATWAGDSRGVRGALPAVAAANKVGPYAYNTDVRVAYFLHVRAQ